MASIGRTIATAGFLSYGLVLALEWWRPGFVTYFWNPEILLILAVLGTILSSWGPDCKRHLTYAIVFLSLSAIVSILAVWISLPSIGSRIIMSIAVVGVLASFTVHQVSKTERLSRY